MAEKDRIKPYLENLVKGYVFDELSDDFLKRLKAEDTLKNTAVPIDAALFAAFASGKAEIKGIDIAKACGLVLGAVPDFPYSPAYKEFLVKTLGGGARALEVLETEGSSLFAEGTEGSGESFLENTFLSAICYFRAALEINPASKNALYGYGLCCREIYANSDEEKKIGDFKAEFIETMEKLTVYHPDFPFAYYYLGYAYLNMGLYIKAQLAWESFLRYIENDNAKNEAFDEINEVKERLTTLKDPVRIEEGILAIESGRYVKGLEILSEYSEGSFESWWPLHYYLGIGYSAMGDAEGAITSFKRGLAYSPSNIDIMEELKVVYEAIGDEVNAAKYADKIMRVKNNMELERTEY